MLILDEPANGLDPEGIAWMRGLLRDFADRGGTVLLSSHLLHEVQATVDHLVVISQGAVVASGPLAELLASSSLLLRTPDPDALATRAPRRRHRLRRRPGPDVHRGRAGRSGHPRDGRARRARAAGAAHRAAPVRLGRPRAALLLTHRREGGPLAGGSSMTSTTMTRPVRTADATIAGRHLPRHPVRSPAARRVGQGDRHPRRPLAAGRWSRPRPSA